MIWRTPTRKKRRYRTLFLSDLHLGMQSAQANALLEFLDTHEAETIYLVGDIVDFWQMSRGMVWPSSHHAVLHAIVGKLWQGSRIILIPGNHDSALRTYCGRSFGGIEVMRDSVHVTASGQRLLVLHGDEFDAALTYPKWMRFIGDHSYELAVYCDRLVNKVRRGLGWDHWSLAAYLKKRLGAAAAFIEEFETALAGEAARRNLDGVICGHIHHGADRYIGSVRYVNCGDWVESCTAVAEDRLGRLQLIRWRQPVSEAKEVVTKIPLLQAA
ncbi:MAG: UDP-2,3-diacylglucosamine diphosphatase [Rhodomicrobium sp.]